MKIEYYKNDAWKGVYVFTYDQDVIIKYCDCYNSFLNATKKLDGEKCLFEIIPILELDSFYPLGCYHRKVKITKKEAIDRLKLKNYEMVSNNWLL